MTETTTNDNADSAVSSDAESQQNAVSDIRMLIAPLAKYAVVAVLIVSVIVTTAILLNDDIDAVDETIAAVETRIAQQNLAEMDVETVPAVNQAMSDTITSTEENVAPGSVAITTTTEPVAALETPAAPLETAEAAVTDRPVTENTVNSDITVVSAQPVPVTPFMPPFIDHKTRIAEQQAYIDKQDQEYLDTLRTRQAERIKVLQQQLARQQKRIDNIEKRNQEIYEMRAASIKRMQQAREESFNRI